MDERNIVELSLRLPAGELGRLARLMEQVRTYGEGADDMTILVAGIWKR